MDAHAHPQTSTDDAEQRFKRAHETLGAAKAKRMRLTAELAGANLEVDEAVKELDDSERSLVQAHQLNEVARTPEPAGDRRQDLDDSLSEDEP